MSEELKISGSKFSLLIRQAPKQSVLELASRYGICYPIAYALLSKHHHNPTHITQLLSFDTARHIAHPSQLKNAQIAVERLLAAIKNEEKILVFGDYDVDGITSTSLLLLSLLPLGANINFFLPIRARHGYGLSVYAVEQAVKNGYKLIITVDNGISAFDAAKRAQELGIDLIITDHHKPHHDLPHAYTIVNPQQHDCQFPHKTLAGVGVIFKIISLLYEQLGKQLPPKIYELVMLGTIADVVPLTHENRHWVTHGLHTLTKQKSIALQALLGNAGITKEKISSRDIGFMLTPQINALGRLDDPRDAVKFLISSDLDAVTNTAQVLKKINEERKAIEQHIFGQIETAIKTKATLHEDYLLMAGHQAWPAGVIGLVAGKCTHQFGKPTFLFHLTSEGIAKGSCRSVKGLDLFALLEENKDLLLSFGGHTAAAGLSLREDNLPLLKERLSASIAQKISLTDLVPTLMVDAPLEFSEINQLLINDLERLEPFGMGNEEPIFIVHDLMQIKPPKLMKDKHVKIMAFSQGIIKPIIFFNRPELFSIFSTLADTTFSVIGTITQNEWQGSISTEILGLDVIFDNN